MGEKSGESVLESALRLIGERSEAGGMERKRGGKKKQKKKNGNERMERKIKEARKR